MLGMLHAPAHRSGEGGAGFVGAVHYEQSLAHAVAHHLRHGGREQCGEDALPPGRRVDHAADLDLVGPKSVDTEEPDEPVLADPQEVVDLVGRSGPQGSPLQLEAAAVGGDAGAGKRFDLVELLGPKPCFGEQPPARSLQPAAPVLCSGRGSFGSPRTRSPTMLRWISAVPPQMVSDR